MNPDQQMEFADYSYLPPEAGEGAVVVAPAATMAEPTPMWGAVPAPRASIDLDGLNPAQREAVETTRGPLLVLAGAGSGKTRVLTMRIAHMIADEGVRPWQILAITFTNKAAAEMRERLAAILPEGTRGMWVCTFHAMCVRMLREDAEAIGYTNNFTIYDDDDSNRMVKSIMSDLRVDQKQFPVRAIRSKISSAKNAMQSAAELESSQNPADRLAGRIYRTLDERLKRANAMDFDDLLIKALELLSKNPDVLAKYQDRFQHISVDEYQDTNHVQYAITNLLAAKYRNLMVVGDDDQSIYSWRGADIQNILDFEKDYPDAKTVRLEQNYRSTGHILNAANAVVAHNSRRKAKRLFTDSGDGDRIKLFQASDERDEGRWIGSEIERLHDAGTSYDDFAVFYRMNSQSRILEDMLLRAGVPYKIVGGTRFFDRAEVRDVTAYLKAVCNPNDDVSVQRVINTPRRGIGSTSIAKIQQLAADEGVSFYAACQQGICEAGLSLRRCVGRSGSSATLSSRAAASRASSRRWSTPSSARRASSARSRPSTPTRRTAASRTSRNSWASPPSSTRPTTTSPRRSSRWSSSAPPARSTLRAAQESRPRRRPRLPPCPPRTRRCPPLQPRSSRPSSSGSRCAATSTRSRASRAPSR